jgi:hypothetical protein
MNAHRIIKNSLIILACLLIWVVSVEITCIAICTLSLGLFASFTTGYTGGSIAGLPILYLVYTSWEYPKLNK